MKAGSFVGRDLGQPWYELFPLMLLYFSHINLFLIIYTIWIHIIFDIWVIQLSDKLKHLASFFYIRKWKIANNDFDKSLNRKLELVILLLFCINQTNFKIKEFHYFWAICYNLYLYHGTAIQSFTVFPVVYRFQNSEVVSNSATF